RPGRRQQGQRRIRRHRRPVAGRSQRLRQLNPPRLRLEARYMPVFRSLPSTLRRMSLAYADEAIHLREVVSLSDRDIARATGSGVSTVSAWLRRERAPRGRRAERLVELSAIADRLAAVLGSERGPGWPAQ